ncbi:hypothetical protein HanIR_Chr11g0533491 [Helianthus annuus]|nr:hypothetical protein HanIR_Chr11g0533491 [Helianthus annuus]
MILSNHEINASSHLTHRFGSFCVEDRNAISTSSFVPVSRSEHEDVGHGSET